MALQGLDGARDRDNVFASMRSRPMAGLATEACGYPSPLVLRLAQRPGAADPESRSRRARAPRLSFGSMGHALADRKPPIGRTLARQQVIPAVLFAVVAVSF